MLSYKQGVLVVGDSNCHFLYIFRGIQHPSLLADPLVVFHNPLLHYYEATD